MFREAKKIAKRTKITAEKFGGFDIFATSFLFLLKTKKTWRGGLDGRRDMERNTARLCPGSSGRRRAAAVYMNNHIIDQ